MKLAIIGTEKLPVPAVRGGAVETLIDMFIQNNERHPLLELDVYSIEDNKAERTSRRFHHTRFIYINSANPLNPFYSFTNRLCLKCHVPFYKNIFLMRTIRELKKRDYDWIVVENRPLFIKPLRRQLGSKVSIALHLHNDTLNPDRFYAQSVIHQCDRIVSVSHFINERVKAAADEHDVQKMRVLYNRIDTSLFQPSLDAGLSRRIRKQCAIPEDRQVVLYYGRLNVGKGVLKLIQSFDRAVQQNKALYLVLCGSFPNKKEYQRIHPALERLPSNAYCVLNYITHEELPAYLSVADMIVLPSLWNEAFGLTIAESMALGKAIITTNAGAIPELIGNGSGLIIKADNQISDRLSAAIVRLAAHPDLRKVLGEKARRSAMLRFHQEGYLDELLEKLN